MEMLIKLTEVYLGLGIALWLATSLAMTFMAFSEFAFTRLKGDALSVYDRAQGKFRLRLVAAWAWPLSIWSPNGRRFLKRAWKGIVK